MPTVLQLNGWRYYFYANERTEPIHIHAKKGGLECKFWLDPEAYAVELAFAHDLGPSELREVKRTVYLNFEQIEAAWQEFKGRKS